MAKDTKKLDILPDSAYVLGDLSPEELKDRVDNEKNLSHYKTDRITNPDPRKYPDRAGRLAKR